MPNPATESAKQPTPATEKAAVPQSPIKLPSREDFSKAEQRWSAMVQAALQATSEEHSPADPRQVAGTTAAWALIDRESFVEELQAQLSLKNMEIAAAHDSINLIVKAKIEIESQLSAALEREKVKDVRINDLQLSNDAAAGILGAVCLYGTIAPGERPVDPPEHAAVSAILYQIQRAEQAEAERDRLRELLQECRDDWIPEVAHLYKKIDAALTPPAPKEKP